MIDKNSALILPDQPYHDEFLQTITKIINWSCWFGVVGRRRPFWKAWSMFLLILLLAVEIAAIWKVIRALTDWAIDTTGSRSVTARFAGTMFYSIAIISLVLSSRLASSWDLLSALWINVGRAMPVNIPPDMTIRKRMKSVVTVMALLAFVEHLMSIISQIGIDCPPSMVLRKYILQSHGFILQRKSFNTWIAIPLLFISNIATILWNFQDLIVILFSMGLTSRYHRLNRYVAKLCKIENKRLGRREMEPVKVYTWRKIREAYVRQAVLVRAVGNVIGPLIMLSCCGNFYFICLQLFLGLTQGFHGDFLKQTYYLMSLFWVIIRISCLVLAAADVKIYSKQALNYLNCCQFKDFNVEIERLQNQLNNDDVALSGMGFFSLNKSVLLQMAGAVITYELMLIQFDDNGSNDGDGNHINVTTT